MSDFKVGDRVRLDATGNDFVVEEVGTWADRYNAIDTTPIVRCGGLWRWASAFTLVPPEKPKYRITNAGNSCEVRDGEGQWLLQVLHGSRSFPLTAEQAVTAARAAAAAIGYEEEV